MELIPGLPNDLARQCLFRVHCSQLSAMSSVSKAWKFVLRSVEFWRQRKQLYNGKQVVLSELLVGNFYKLSLLEHESKILSELPRIDMPEFPAGIPENFKFVAASFKWGFVVIGTFRRPYLDKSTFCNKVFVFDYISATWQRGADMPEGLLSVFRSTSDRDRMVYVLCKQDLDSYTKCIMVYDVMKEEWIYRIEARWPWMIYQRNKTHFLDEWMQGGHNCAKRAFDVFRWKWQLAQWDFLDGETYGLCLSDDGDSYSYHSIYQSLRLAIYEDNTSMTEIGKVTSEWKLVDFITAWKKNVLVI